MLGSNACPSHLCTTLWCKGGSACLITAHDPSVAYGRRCVCKRGHMRLCKGSVFWSSHPSPPLSSSVIEWQNPYKIWHHLCGITLRMGINVADITDNTHTHTHTHTHENTQNPRPSGLPDDCSECAQGAGHWETASDMSLPKWVVQSTAPRGAGLGRVLTRRICSAFHQRDRPCLHSPRHAPGTTWCTWKGAARPRASSL